MRTVMQLLGEANMSQIRAPAQERCGVAASTEPRAANLSVSVIIPAFRAAHTIARAVRSVLDQSLPAAEIIVVDDGSPDDLASALEPFGGSVRLVRKENGGAASARNLGIELATGGLIAFLDADDYWEPTKLERQVELFVRHAELGLVAGQFYYQSPGGERTPLGRSTLKFDSVLRLRGERAFDVATYVWTGTVMIRRAVLGHERFVSGLEPAEDRDLWVRIILSAPMYLISEPLATFVYGPGSLSCSSLDRDCTNMLRVVGRHEKILGFRARRYWRSYTYLRWAARETRPSRALLNLMKSYYQWPLPYGRASVAKPWARPKVGLVSLLRLARLYPRRS
jgi:glycosyltransferase involved in cell wall biosynthesis